MDHGAGFAGSDVRAGSRLGVGVDAGGDQACTFTDQPFPRTFRVSAPVPQLITRGAGERRGDQLLGENGFPSARAYSSSATGGGTGPPASAATCRATSTRDNGPSPISGDHPGPAGRQRRAADRHLGRQRHRGQLRPAAWPGPAPGVLTGRLAGRPPRRPAVTGTKRIDDASLHRRRDSPECALTTRPGKRRRLAHCSGWAKPRVPGEAGRARSYHMVSEGARQ